MMAFEGRLPIPICRGCGLQAGELDEYVVRCEEEGGYYKSPADLVRRDEGTYNRNTGMFWCSRCYIDRGMPSGTA